MSFLRRVFHLRRGDGYNAHERPCSKRIAVAKAPAGQEQLMTYDTLKITIGADKVGTSR
jgi:hypothetical protein